LYVSEHLSVPEIEPTLSLWLTIGCRCRPMYWPSWNQPLLPYVALNASYVTLSRHKTETCKYTYAAAVHYCGCKWEVTALTYRHFTELRTSCSHTALSLSNIMCQWQWSSPARKVTLVCLVKSDGSRPLGLWL